MKPNRKSTMEFLAGNNLPARYLDHRSSTRFYIRLWELSTFSHDELFLGNMLRIIQNCLIYLPKLFPGINKTKEIIALLLFVTNFRITQEHMKF